MWWPQSPLSRQRHGWGGVGTPVARGALALDRSGPGGIRAAPLRNVLGGSATCHRGTQGAPGFRRQAGRGHRAEACTVASVGRHRQGGLAGRTRAGRCRPRGCGRRRCPRLSGPGGCPGLCSDLDRVTKTAGVGGPPHGLFEDRSHRPSPGPGNRGTAAPLKAA